MGGRPGVAPGPPRAAPCYAGWCSACRQKARGSSRGGAAGEPTRQPSKRCTYSRLDSSTSPAFQPRKGSGTGLLPAPHSRISHEFVPGRGQGGVLAAFLREFLPVEGVGLTSDPAPQLLQEGRVLRAHPIKEGGCSPGRHLPGLPPSDDVDVAERLVAQVVVVVPVAVDDPGHGLARDGLRDPPQVAARPGVNTVSKTRIPFPRSTNLALLHAPWPGTARAA